ncbi:hypothetical protein RHSIM_Rhsim11G0154900 [Rhododendron simsii]|uniref:RING-type domain-containing protein n=1 Tax=Rhododendron simsii TaxID=118357 RepID=A0A834GAN4_RHOSS|nr:hypothetical protein RHSIM_Rhsim11G0154900 [Rhododendron simsii]
MTSASELFYTRRSSRLNPRNSLEQGLDSDRIFHHHSLGNGSTRRHHHFHHHHSTLQNHSNSINNNTRRDHRNDADGCDPLRRSPLVRHQPPPRPSASERDTVHLEEGSNQLSSGNIINLDNLGGIPNSHRLNGNDRLPGAVLLARERLLERLRSVSLSRNGRNNRASPAFNRTDLILGDDYSLIDAGDWETDNSGEWLAGGPLITDSAPQIEQLLVPPQRTTKRPPGLTQVELNCLQLEVFNQSKCSVEGEILRASRECSICLESFVEGDELMCLPCAHRFHSSCLDPWVRTCGDCPYCRRGVVYK